MGSPSWHFCLVSIFFVQLATRGRLHWLALCTLSSPDVTHVIHLGQSGTPLWEWLVWSLWATIHHAQYKQLFPASKLSLNQWVGCGQTFFFSQLWICMLNWSTGCSLTHLHRCWSLPLNLFSASFKLGLTDACERVSVVSRALPGVWEMEWKYLESDFKPLDFGRKLCRCRVS